MQKIAIPRRGRLCLAILCTSFICANAQSRRQNEPRSYGQQLHAVINTGAKLGMGNYLALGTGDKATLFILEKDFVPLSISANAQVTATLAFAGYGITAPELKYDDYEGIDAKGKVVIVLRHEPQENDKQSIFNSTRLARYADVANKAINAKNHGALGMIVVNDAGNHAGHPDTLGNLEDANGADEMSIPVIEMTAAAGNQILSPAGKTSDVLRQEIDKELKPHSFAIDGSRHVDLRVNIQRDGR